jgi:hypothetical protein
MHIARAVDPWIAAVDATFGGNLAAQSPLILRYSKQERRTLQRAVAILDQAGALLDENKIDAMSEKLAECHLLDCLAE